MASDDRTPTEKMLFSVDLCSQEKLPRRSACLVCGHAIGAKSLVYRWTVLESNALAGYTHFTCADEYVEKNTQAGYLF